MDSTLGEKYFKLQRLHRTLKENFVNLKSLCFKKLMKMLVGSRFMLSYGKK